MQDGILLRDFEQNTIDPELMSHENHVRLAWYLLQQCNLAEAQQRYCAALIQLTIRINMPDKYNERITLKLLELIQERSATPNLTFETFAATNPDLFTNWKALIT